MNQIDLKGRVAVVTGGARGIGYAVATRMLQSGASVVLWDVTADRLKTSQAELSKLGKVETHVVDITDEPQVLAAADAAVKALGKIDILVNSAGITGPNVKTWEYSSKDFRQVQDINLIGTFHCCKAVVAPMMKNDYGRIINIASIAGLNGNPSGMNTIAYNTSKGAVINFTRTLAAEWGRYNINVNAICPGFFVTKLSQGLIQSLGEENMTAHVPLNRLGDDEDLKGITLLYASEAGKHITGQWLAVDGGVSVVTGA